MDISINFAIHVFVAVVKMQLFPEWARPVGQYMVSELRQITKDIDLASNMLKPVIEERLRDLEMPSCEQTPDDLIQWLVESLPAEEKTDVRSQAHLQLILAAASIHTTNNLVTDCIYDLAANPDAQEMLREEARQVLEVEHGWARKESMAKLKKLDSFMKETQRLAGNISEWQFCCYWCTRLTCRSLLHPQGHQADRPVRRHPPALGHQAAGTAGRHLAR